MAGSRLEKLGSVFSRTRDLLRSGVIPEAKKPIWFDVYVAFPPLREPLYREVHPQYGKIQEVVLPILYKEDEIRAKFYKAYGNGPRAFELSKLNFKSTCQRFVEKYLELQKQGEIDDNKLFEETGKALLAEGLLLRRKVTENVTQQASVEAGTRNPVLEMQLQSLLQEMQEPEPEPEQEPQPEPELETTDAPEKGPVPS